MGSNKRNARSRYAPKQFTLEQLEARQLMAGDTLAAGLSHHSPSTASGRFIPDVRAPFSGRSGDQSSTPTPVASALATPRTIDGTGNNLANPLLGSVGQQLARGADAEYSDGVSAPAGADRPSAREISNALSAQELETEASDRQLSAYIYVWGQFLDHDIDLTPTGTTEKLPIAVPADDELFDPNGTGTQTMSFSRSVYDLDTGLSADNPREQINKITAWIDGSMIYGSDAANAASLRTFQKGKLKTSAGALPPTDAAGNFLAGDERANENIELTSMHTLFLREHNSWAAKIARENPKLTDEQIFQRARAIVIAEIQSITYNEFLPALLGRGAVDRYQGYDATVDPSIANEFSTAAFRLHTLINDDVEFFGNEGRAVRDEVELRDAFFNPALFSETGPDGILKYAASTVAQEVDPQIVDGLRNFLFGQPGQGGLDLASLNIQRGRDHGLADYNSVREAYGLPRVTSFAEITYDAALAQKLEEVYGDVDNIDLWVGAISEDHLPGASVGATSSAIIADQFERLRDGDRYWYQSIFAGKQLQQLQNTSLADVIRRNTTVANIQDDVFFMRGEVSGQVYADTNGNRGFDRREVALAGIAVELLNDEGDVVATTKTDARGKYRFTQFGETGDYTIRVVTPAGMVATTAKEKSVLLSRGSMQLGNLNFGLRRAVNAPAAQLAGVDAAFAQLAVGDTTTPSTRLRRRPR